LVGTSLACILALGGIGFPFHPSFPALALLLGSAAGLYLATRWSYNKYPHLSYKHAHSFFEGEAAMAAENSAIGYITPKHMLAGHQQEIQVKRDRKLEAAREQRKNRRQRVA
jgi:hypothetical protein